jgi:hypothetical protein
MVFETPEGSRAVVLSGFEHTCFVFLVSVLVNFKIKHYALYDRAPSRDLTVMKPIIYLPAVSLPQQWLMI